MSKYVLRMIYRELRVPNLVTDDRLDLSPGLRGRVYRGYNRRPSLRASVCRET